MMKRWKTLSVAAMTAAAMLLASCGGATMMEEYSFGYAQLKAGDVMDRKQAILDAPLHLEGGATC